MAADSVLEYFEHRFRNVVCITWEAYVLDMIAGVFLTKIDKGQNPEEVQ